MSSNDETDAATSQQIKMEIKSIKEHGMTRYELCWDELHSQMVKQSKTIHGGGWPVFVLERMERIENEICGPLEEEESPPKNNASE